MSLKRHKKSTLKDSALLWACDLPLTYDQPKVGLVATHCCARTQGKIHISKQCISLLLNHSVIRWTNKSRWPRSKMTEPKMWCCGDYQETFELFKTTMITVITWGQIHHRRSTLLLNTVCFTGWGDILFLRAPECQTFRSQASHKPKRQWFYCFLF